MSRKATLLRTKTCSDDILQFAMTVTSLGKELATISSFPPAVAAVSTLLLILETIREVKTNQEACLRLAQRAVKILIDVNNQMDGRWETAPKTLIKSLEKYRDTLASIQRYMALQAEVKWAKRFATKGSITESLSDLDELLTDATQGFQIATLISIHHAVSSAHPELSNGTDPDIPTSQICSDEVGSPTAEERDNQNVPRPLLALTNSEDFIHLQEWPEYQFHTYISSDKASGHHFQKYKRSEIRLCTPTRKTEGWWSSAAEAEVGGRKVFIKLYGQESGNTIKDWLQDVKLLQNLFHPHLPQMLGLSARNAPVPFVLLVDVLTNTPQEIIIQNIRSTTVESCTEMILRFHSEIQDAALFLRQSLHLESVQIQSYLDDASFGTDRFESIIVGLPTYSKGHYLTYRNHGIVESLKHVCMRFLPQVTGQMCQSDKLRTDRLFSEMIRHFFAQHAVISEPHAFLDDDEESIDVVTAFGEKLIPSWGWRKYDPCTSHHFMLGDFGYVSRGTGIESFIKLGNIFTDKLATCSATESVFGVQYYGYPSRPSSFSHSSFIDGLACWPLVINNNVRMTGQVVHKTTLSRDEAYRFLLESGKGIVKDFNLERRYFRLVTGVENKLDFDICNYSHPTTPELVTTTTYFHTALGMKRSPYLSHTPTHITKGGIPPALKSGWVCATKVRAGVIETVSLAGGSN
ncbi:hypothetical protein BDZ94DRAFT_911322 [Collybia nuda]|uniref:Mixed lineage kinase domain-containing protein n=1 Tax=Collybia nuda TaxID=64659 RepID=A0A9P5YFX2_9AGAR|nr:hypothetical protein BDZ94DRAFT_911322 [Collybia nuda]